MLAPALTRVHTEQGSDPNHHQISGGQEIEGDWVVENRELGLEEWEQAEEE